MFKPTLLLAAWLCLGGATAVPAQAGRNLREQHQRRTTSTAYTGRIVRFELVNSESDNVVVSSLTDGMIITSSKPSFSINAIVVTNGTSLRTREVLFGYTVGDWPLDYYRAEYGAPYALCGNQGRNYFKCPMLGYGTHYVKATPRNSIEDTGPAFECTFTIIKPPSDPAAATARARAITSFVNNITLTGTTIAGPTPSMNGTTTIVDPVLRWLILDDPLQLSPTTPAARFQLQQRYAAFRSIVAVNKMYPRYLDNVNRHECDWDDGGGSTITGCETRDLSGDIGVQQVLTSFNLFDVPLALSDELGLLSSLVWFYAERNDIVGTIPSSIERWTNLTSFTLSDIKTSTNVLSIPSTIGNWKKLRSFMWEDDRFHDRWHIGPKRFLTGTLPSEIALWTHLNNFYVQGWNLGGTIPSAIGAWSMINSFDLVSSSITGTIPPSLGTWSSLVSARFRETNLTGSVPKSLCNVTSLRHLEADCLSEVSCSCCTECF